MTRFRYTSSFYERENKHQISTIEWGQAPNWARSGACFSIDVLTCFPLPAPISGRWVLQLRDSRQATRERAETRATRLRGQTFEKYVRNVHVQTRKA